MFRSFSRSLVVALLSCLWMLAILAAPAAWGQTATVGSVTVSVLDQSGGYVAGAALSLKNLDTNNVLTGTTATGGVYTFTTVPFGNYELSVAKDGFSTKVFSSVVVQAGRVTDVKAILQVGAATERVVVTATAAPLLQTTSDTIATTIDMKQINDLPIVGRDVSQLVFLTPGYSGVAGFGTWNGLPVISQSNTVDGVVANTNRMKFAGDSTPAMQARLEDIQEMTVQTSHADLNQGFGEASMGTSYLTKGGTNSYHGEVFEDFRNTDLNANSWTNNAIGFPRNTLIRNEFGGSAGGPILKNKFFFFGSFSARKQPGSFTASQTYLSPAAQQGIYQNYQCIPASSCSGGFTQGQNINLFTQVAAPFGLPAAVNSPAAPAPCAAGEAPCPNNTWGSIAAEIAEINKNIQAPGVIISPSGDPNTETVNWQVPNPDRWYFPAMRLDYNAKQNLRINFAFEEDRETFQDTTPPLYPGPDFANQTASFSQKNYTSSLGLDWTVSPTVVNDFRVGYLYNWLNFGFGPAPIWVNGGPTGNGQPQINWALGNSGQSFNLATGQYYPTVSASDTLTLLRGNHNVSLGFDYAREQDHYWNAPDGIPNISLGLVSGDPAFDGNGGNNFENFFANADSNDRGEAEALYATLVGRITNVGPIGSGFPFDPATGGYTNVPGSTVNLDELQRSWGLFAHDAYHFRPTLTINYGLRWDFIGDDHDLAHQYLGTPLADFFGPSGLNNIFNPGTLIGTNTPAFVAQGHQYGAWDVTPQPTVGVAWNPNYSEGVLGKLFGGGKTVIRAGFDLKRFTEPNQYFWNFGTNHGIGYFQNFFLNAAPGGGNACAGTTGSFAPGSLSLGTLVGPNTSCDYSFAPPFYQKVVQQSDFAFNYFWGEAGFDPNIKQPYVQEWNFGIQRQIGNNNVLEVRYLGSRSVHQWIAEDPNEVNIFENGFLSEFKAAQTNLAINAQNGINSFADNSGMGASFAGEQPLPIFDAAFAGEAAGGTGVPFTDYGTPAFIRDLNRGAAGDLAYRLSVPNAGNASYLCNLVGSSFTPCANGTFGTATTPGNYPVNFFQANPYGASCLFCAPQEFMTNGGYSMYNGLQVDFRQKQWHGMQFDANYTFSHTLGVQPDFQWLGTFNQFTMRDLRLSYGPTLFDLRHVMHVSGTYDLPFGAGKAFLNRSGWVDKLAGGWTIGNIFQYETGFPFPLTGGWRTFNNYGDGGLVFNGVTLHQLQSSIGVFHPKAGQFPNVPLGPWAYDFNPSVLVAGSSFSPPANCVTGLAGVCQNTNPGTFTGTPYLYGPHLWNMDMSLTKIVPITEKVRFVLQGEALNVFNHPEWANPGGGIRSGSSFGQAGIGGLAASELGETSGSRQLEIRAKVEF